MSIGHGAMGFRSNLRGFAELLDEEGADRRPFLNLQLGKEMTVGQWVNHSGGTYRQRAHFVFSDGILRDIVAVIYGGMVGLTRVESIADCVATAGTYYFTGEDALLFPGTPGWDDGVNAWDAGGNFWDLYPPAELYVHLHGDLDPNSYTVVALLGFYLSGLAEAHPTLGPNLFLNPGFESWASATDANNWTEITPAGTSITRESTIVREGTFSAKLTTDGAAGATAVLVQGPSGGLKVGRRYRMSGFYLTPTSNSAGFLSTLFVGEGANFMIEDGRTYATTGTPPLPASTGGEWRRFIFDFIAPHAGAAVGVVASEAGDAGSIYVDSLELRRIYRFNQYDARLAMDSIPEVMTACGRFFGTQTMGLAALSLLNGGDAGGGYWESILGQLLVHRKPAHLFVGGVFKDGTEIYSDEWQPRFAGLIDEHAVEDSRATFQLQDWRSFLKKNSLPRHLYDDRANVEARSIGAGRPLLFGEWLDTNSYLRPVRVGTTATTGYGIYEVADPTVGTANGIVDATAVQSWLDEQSADKLDLSSAVTLTNPTDFTVDGPAARITILRDVRLIRLDVKSYIDFVRNGVTYAASVGPGLNAIDTWCSQLQAAMRTASGSATLTVTYSNTIHKVAIADTGAAELTLLPKTGANRHVGFWDELGFDSGADRSAFLTYEAENALFTNADNDHVVRCFARGYKDDAAGTYTGSPDAMVEQPEHIARFIISRALGVGDSPFDASFLSVSTYSTALQVLIDEGMDSDEVLARIEQSAMATIVMDGGGIFYWTPYSNSTSRRTFYDRDYLSFSMSRHRGDVAHTVRLLTPRRLKRDWSIERQIPAAPARHWNFAQVDVWTYLSGTPTGGNIAAMADRYVQLYSASPRQVTFTAKGKLADLKVADIITLNRARGLDPAGALVGVKFRIIGLSFNDTAGTARCTALEYIPLV